MEDVRKANDGGVEIPDAVKTLLSNPALLKGLGAALGAMQTDAPKAEPAERSVGGENVEKASSMPPIDGLSALLSNPQAMEKLPQVIAAIRPLMAASATEEKSVATAASVSTESAACRDRLLLALKPFLSPGRCEAVDAILQISRLGAVFKQIR